MGCGCAGAKKRSKSNAGKTTKSKTTVINYYAVPPADCGTCVEGIFGEDVTAAKTFVQTNPGWWMQGRHEPA